MNKTEKMPIAEEVGSSRKSLQNGADLRGNQAPLGSVLHTSSHVIQGDCLALECRLQEGPNELSVLSLEESDRSHITHKPFPFLQFITI
jgi:hypothetical protein